MKGIVFLLAGILTGCSALESGRIPIGGGYYIDAARPARASYTPGIPVYDAYGRPRQFVPADGGGGALLGPIRPNAFGPGVGMDATGRPVRAAPWP